MIMNIIDQVLQSNKEYWAKENVSNIGNGMLLYENFYSSPQLCYGISKVALCIAKALQLKPAVLPAWNESEMTGSMCDTKFQLRDKLISIILKHPWSLLKTFCITKARLLELSDGDANIGEYIYDSILIKYKIKTVNGFSIKERFFVVLQMCYYYFFKDILNSYPINAVVLGDNVYRYGLLFELCRLKGIVCYTPINLNSLFIRRFKSEEDFRRSYLSKELVDELCKNVDYNSIIHDYYEKRYSGKIEQHDVLSAYGDKQVTVESEFSNKYHLDNNKKTVVIMSHVFADAPHVYLDSLYDDYWDWFVGSLQNLLMNPNINLLVKEHPSAHLYGQKGLIKEYLTPLHLDYLLVDDKESTESILNNADIVVTCGGTIGMEFSYRGKNVVLASYPPFGRLGFTKEFSSRKEYEEFLRDKIQQLQPLDKEQLEMARKVSYIVFCRQDNSPKELEMGGDAILLGKEYDDSILYNNILSYNKIPLKFQRIYQVIDGFVKTGKGAMFK